MPDRLTSDPTTLFVGLGRMGAPMARRYAETRPTLVHDSDDAAVARTVSDSPAGPMTSLDQIPASVDTVILMLPHSGIVESVLLGPGGRGDGLFRRLSEGALVIDMGSSRPASTRALADHAADLGLDFVDAPVSGGVAKAVDGTLSIMMGGADGALDRAQPHVTPLGSQIFRLGPSGAGHCAKVLNNWLSACNLAAAGEILCIAAQAGIEPAAMLDTLNGSTGRNQATEVKYPAHVLTGTYGSGFAFDLMVKDLRTADEVKRGHSSYTPVLDAALDVIEKAGTFLGAGDRDHTEVAKFYQHENGVVFDGTETRKEAM
ncbi:NAD(P)-dependent oxidoreductase [Mycolicibacterium stellerae]|uniref:NAD(P)-dependent oxidoreductase n=1 Tax=Mycolicibacterium stellerae TaxID=2358193 RepID=UPI0013DE5D43|nr:NAD(P)-dependent oxidoreductase [Mycolicibacterium stellerae]